MEKIDFYIKESLRQNNIIPERYNKMINKTLNEIDFSKNKLKEKITRAIIAIITTILGMSTICIAGPKIGEYANNMKQGRILSGGLVQTNTQNGEDLLSEMTYNDEMKFYYTVIKDYEKYSIYKEKIDDLANVEKNEFENNVVFIMTKMLPGESDERNLIINEIEVKDDTTYIKLERDEDNTFSNIFYAVLPKEKIKDNIEFEILKTKIESPDFEKIENLPSDYSAEEAIQDGCIVIVKAQLLSDNIEKLEEMAETKQELYIRIYDKVADDEVEILDIMYKEGMYYANSSIIQDENRNIRYYSFEKINKVIANGENCQMIIYSGDNQIDSTREEGWPIAIIDITQ